MAVIRLDKIAGVHLASVKHTQDMTNGLFFNLGALEVGETELYNVNVPATDADLQDEFLIHTTPEVMYDSRKQGFKHFVVEAGDAGRAHHITKGDIVTLTADLFDATPVVEEFAVPQLGSLKLAPSVDGMADGEAGAVDPSLKFKVIQETTLGYDNAQAFVLRAVKA